MMVGMGLNLFHQFAKGRRKQAKGIRRILALPNLMHHKNNNNHNNHNNNHNKFFLSLNCFGQFATSWLFCFLAPHGKDDDDVGSFLDNALHFLRTNLSAVIVF